MKRSGNNPKRRIAQIDLITKDGRAELAGRVSYQGSGHHKRYPANYGLERTAPRPTKSLCDLLRIVKLQDAKALLEMGILCGMFSDFRYEEDFPKFVWCVDDDGEVYEAKTNRVTPGVYHGYRLEEEDNMRDQIKAAWKERCLQAGL